MVTDAMAAKRPILYPVVLIVAGVIGWFAAFQLLVEDILLSSNHAAALNCDFSLLVQCKANLESWQGSLLGFPNPILGVTGWMAVVVVGAALLAGAHFDRWFMIVFNLGVAAAMLLVIFLILTSILVLGTLCPWCMLTWSVTIPVFWLVTLDNFRAGVFGVPPRAKAFFAHAYGWIPAITVFCYLAIALLAQLRLDAFSYLLKGI